MIENKRKDNNFIELKSLAESFKLKQINNNHSLLVDSNSNSNNDKKRTSYDLSSLKVK